MSTPTVAELEEATAATAAAIADPTADIADVYLAAESEEALYAQICTGPCDTPALEAADPEPEMEIELCPHPNSTAGKPNGKP
jgi:hypothetical protein